MATDYGTDIAAVDDLPDPEVLVSGTSNVAYAMARRWYTPRGGQGDVGETEPYDSIDVRQWLGGNFDLNDASVQADLEAQAAQVQTSDPRVTSCAVTATFTQGVITLKAQGFGPDGPFSFVMQVSQLTGVQIFPGQT